MTFDLDTAWKDAVRLLKDNFSLLAVVAGVFYFLPYMAALLWIPGLSEMGSGAFDPEDPNLQAMLGEMFATYWWAFLLLSIVQGLGLLTMLVLMRRHATPTVGEAIAAGLTLILTYLATQILVGFLLGLAVVLVAGVPAMTGFGVLIFAGAVASIVVFAYLMTRFSMTSPVIAIENEKNPISAIRRAWRLTKPAAWRLFAFYALLLVAFIVISTVASFVLGLIFAMGGEATQSFGQAAVSSLSNAFLAVFVACVWGAVHRQLTRLSAPHERDVPPPPA